MLHFSIIHVYSHSNHLHSYQLHGLPGNSWTRFKCYYKYWLYIPLHRHLTYIVHVCCSYIVLLRMMK
jgi:hypothetical protein